jgi:hypothetical protein
MALLLDAESEVTGDDRRGGIAVRWIFRRWCGRGGDDSDSRLT